MILLQYFCYYGNNQLMKLHLLFFCIFGFLILLFCGGCECFSTPQERSGINPKPFNAQSNWEVRPMGGRIFN